MPSTATRIGVRSFRTREVVRRSDRPGSHKPIATTPLPAPTPASKSPRWLWQQFPYPNLHFGTIAEPCQAEYTEHAFRCFSDPATRVNLLRLGYTDETAVLPSAEQLVDRPPICRVWGKANRLLPYEVGKKQLDILTPEEVHVIEGRGYAVAWDAPDRSTRSSRGSSTGTHESVSRFASSST